MLKKLFILFTGLTLLVMLVGAAIFGYLVVVNPGAEIDQVNIKKILAMESPVFYKDSQAKIGVFFRDAHRQYISYERIPPDFINSVLAAEDHNFFSHSGVDFPGMLRALVANIRAGRIVQGGSTITQQTAKNLFKRKDRSLRSKLKELLFAVQLEYHYPKELILEFYANQFYVSGNGLGLGTAARYYFDKAVEDLDLLESAFIAGSVKRPNYYNPFIKHSENEALQARVRAKQRAGYVLNQLYRLGLIDAARYQENIAREIPFRQGKLYYSLNIMMDMVKEALASPEIEEALAGHGIENVATSGIRIFTTVEEGLQKDAFFALRKELSRLDVRLRGYERREVQQEYGQVVNGGDTEIGPGAFLFGRVTALTKSAEAPAVEVAFEQRTAAGIAGGRIDKAGLMPLLAPLMKWREQRWTEAKDRDLSELLAQLEVGDLVYVHVREVDALAGECLLNLEKYPQIQGAIVALQEGTIRAVVGGKENHYFNRAIAAKRSMGSIMKPLVFAAAIQLGWNSIDVLNNERNIFLYQKQPYFPRPDHHSPYKRISLSWAGVNSENLATVWLLYHLCDRLTPAQFKEVAAHLDLDRRPGESYGRYVARIRDRHGIVADEDALRRAAFEMAVAEMEPDLLFAGRLNENDFLKRLHYGADFDMYRTASENLQGPDYETAERRDLLASREEQVRRELLGLNFLECRRLQQALQRLRDDLLIGPLPLAAPAQFQDIPTARPGEDAGEAGWLYQHQQTGEFIFAAVRPDPASFAAVNRTELKQRLQAMDTAGQKEFWDAVLIGGGATAPTLDLLAINIDQKYKQLAALPAYSPEVLYHIRDFRVLTALNYLVGLSRALGVRSELEPVLSFPLGSNVISLMEVAMVYEGLVTGATIRSGAGETGDLLAIIERIENSDGELIYQPERTTAQVVDPRTALAVSNILRNVVKFGTGRQAGQDVKLRSHEPEKEELLRQFDLHFPLFGKTGTANRFSNAAFAGIIPGVANDRNGWDIGKGYILATYVGFDDNTPMVRHSTHITGSTGALPLWTRFAGMLLNEKDYAARLDLIDLSFATDAVTGRPSQGLIWPDLGQIEVAVDEDDGLVPAGGEAGGEIAGPSAATILTFGEPTAGNGVTAARYFRPYWDLNP